MVHRWWICDGGGDARTGGTAEREAESAMLDRRGGSGPIMLGAGKAYDASAFVDELRVRERVPRIAVNRVVSKLEVVRRTRIDARTMRHATCAPSQRCRKRIEEAFGWVNAQASMAKTRLRGPAEVEAAFKFRIVAYNLGRLPKLLAASPG